MIKIHYSVNEQKNIAVSIIYVGDESTHLCFSSISLPFSSWNRLAIAVNKKKRETNEKKSRDIETCFVALRIQ